jgi:hypothetical protein
MLRRTFFLLGLLLVAATAAMAASSPKPAKSKYLVTASAGIVLDPDEGAHYGMTYRLRSFPLPDLYVVSLFENPEDPQTPLRAELRVEGGRNEFELNSAHFKTLRNDTLYSVELFIYADPAHTTLWGQHKQKVLFSLPPEFAAEAKRRFGVVY